MSCLLPNTNVYYRVHKISPPTLGPYPQPQDVVLTRPHCFHKIHLNIIEVGEDHRGGTVSQESDVTNTALEREGTAKHG
jgi:hypothetical protein